MAAKVTTSCHKPYHSVWWWFTISSLWILFWANSVDPVHLHCYSICNFWTHSSHLSPLTWEVVGAPQMTLQQYLSTFPCLLLPSGNLQTPFLHVIFPFLLSSSPSCSFHCPLQNCLHHARGSWDVAILSVPWLGDLHALSYMRRFCCESPHSSHGLCMKHSEVSYSISSQGFGSFSRFLLSRSSSHRHKGRWIRWASTSACYKRDVLVPPYDLQSRKSCCCLGYHGRNLWFSSSVRDACSKVLEVLDFF